MAGAARVLGSAIGQVGIELALEKVAFNKDVQQTTKQTESAFSKAFGKIGKMTKSAFTGMKNVVSNALSRVRDNFTQTFNKISNIMKVAMVAGSAFIIKFGKDAVSAASETQSAWTGLYSIVNGTGKSFSEAQGFLKEYVNDGLIPLTDAVTAYKNLAARGYDTEQIEGIMTSLKDAAAFGRQSSYSYGEAIKSATEGLKNENSILVDNAGVTKNVAKMWDEYAASIGTTANNLTLAQKRQAEYNGILEETKFQQGDAQKYADTYAGKIAKLNTAFYNLKVTVGQVVAPIVELFLPAITTAINAVTKLFNKLKSVMAVFGLEMKEYIGGSTSSAINSATESANGLSSGLDSAGTTAQKTAKKIKRAFAGVDEINVLNMPDKSKSSGGGSDGTSGIGGSGMDNSVTDGLTETQEEIEQKLDWLSRSAHDWGVAFGEAINTGLSKIPWDAIQATVISVATKLAEFLNGAVVGIDWHLLGTTLGEGFNTVIYGLNAFYETFNWHNLGIGLGKGINGIIDSVDWETTGEYLGRKFSSVFQVLNGMFQAINWVGLGDALARGFASLIEHIDFDSVFMTFSNGLEGISKSLNKFFTSIDWGKMAKDIVTSLNKAIRETDWKEVGAVLGNGINSAISFMFEAVTTFDWKELGISIGEYINSAIEKVDWGKLGQTLSNGIKGAIRTLTELIKEIDWFKIGKSIVDFLLNIDWMGLLKQLGSLLWNAFLGIGEFLWGVVYGIGENIVKGLWDGITNFLSDPLGWLKEHLVDPIVQAVKDLFGVHSPSTVFAEIGSFLIEGLWSGISGAKDWIVGKWEEVKGWFSGIVKTARVKITQKWNDIKKSWTDLTSNIKNKTADMKAKVATKWNDIKKNWTNITSNIKNKTADMKAKIATKWSSLKNSWSNITSNIKNKTADMKARIATTWSSLRNTWSNLMSNFKDKTVEIKAKVGGVIGNFKSTINEQLIKPINKKLPSIFPKIPYLAQGSWFAKNNPTLAVVGDNKHEPEIVTPESKIKDQVVKGIQEAGTTNTNQQIDLTIKLEYPDGKYLIKEINDAQIKDGKISLLV